MIGVKLMASSIIDKKSPRRGRRAEHRATDLRWRTRMKRSSLSLGRLDLSSYYFSQAFEDRHFTEREISFGTLNELRRTWIVASGLGGQKATVIRLRNTSAPFSCLDT